MTDQSSKDRIEESGKLPEQPATVSRRALLRSGVTAMPAILTLQSGAALARTSNLISASAPGTTDVYGRTLCLDTSTVWPAGPSGDVYDLGEPPRAEVTIITDRDHRVVANNREGGEITEGAMCESVDTTFYYKDGDVWQPVNVPSRGIVVSSGAMTSIADHVIDTLM